MPPAPYGEREAGAPRDLTAAITSGTPLQRAISAGDRSIEPFQTFRWSSYLGSPGRTSSPLNAALSPRSGVASTPVSAVSAVTVTSLCGTPAPALQESERSAPAARLLELGLASH